MKQEYLKLNFHKLVLPNKDTVLVKKQCNGFMARVRWIKNFGFIRMLMSQRSMYEVFLFLPAALFNRTELTANHSYLKVEQLPFEDYIPMTFYKSSQIKRVFVGPLEDYAEWELLPNKSEGLHIELINGEVKLILWDLHDTTLKYFEEEIIKALKHERSTD